MSTYYLKMTSPTALKTCSCEGSVARSCLLAWCVNVLFSGCLSQYTRSLSWQVFCSHYTGAESAQLLCVLKICEPRVAAVPLQSWVQLKIRNGSLKWIQCCYMQHLSWCLNHSAYNPSIRLFKMKFFLVTLKLHQSFSNGKKDSVMICFENKLYN